MAQKKTFLFSEIGSLSVNRFAIPWFWTPCPALFVGLSLLLGTAYAFFPHPVLVFILVFLAGSKGSWKGFCLAIVCGALAFSYALFTLPTRNLPQEKIPGVGIFHIEQVKLASSFFNKSLLYKGTLISFSAASGEHYENLPCHIYLPTKGSRPLANCDYKIEGTLCEKGDFRFSFKPEKKKEWIPIPNSSSFAESRFLAKQAFYHHLKTHIEDPSARNLLYALFSGDVDEKLLSLSFGKVGLQHLLAVSGFHFTLIAALCGLLFRAIFPYKTALIALVLLLSCYALFVGGSCAIQRAYLAFFFVYVGKLFHLQIRGLQALGLGLIVAILQTPLNLLDLGFQFSFLCTLAIFVAYPLLNTAFQSLLPKRPYFVCLRLSFLEKHAYLLCQWLRSTLALNLSVHLLSLPLVLFCFHKFPYLSLAYNLIFPISLALSLLLLLLSLAIFPLIPPLGAFLHSLNNDWTSLILFFTSNPPAKLDFSLRTSMMSAPLAIFLIAALFFLTLSFSKQESASNPLGL